MNTDNGNIYRGESAIFAAIQRGEPIVELKGEAAEIVQEYYEQEERRKQTGNGRTRAFLDGLRKARLKVPR